MILHKAWHQIVPKSRTTEMSSVTMNRCFSHLWKNDASLWERSARRSLEKTRPWIRNRTKIDWSPWSRSSLQQQYVLQHLLFVRWASRSACSRSRHQFTKKTRTFRLGRRRRHVSARSETSVEESDRIPARRWISDCELEDDRSMSERMEFDVEEHYSSIAKAFPTGERSSGMVCSRISSAV